jgi:hypothetical protein
MSERGTVERWFGDKRYGFIVDAYGAKHFAHAKNLVGTTTSPSETR